MSPVTTSIKTLAAAAAVAALLPAAASAAPRLDGTFPVDAGQIATGPDGGAWFTGGSKKFGRIATDGTITEYDTPNNAVPLAIAAGPDVAGGPTNRIWLAYNDGVMKVDPANPNAGTPFPSGNKIDSGVRDMAADRDGNLWVIDGDGVTKVTNSAAPTFTEHGAGNSGREIALGGDGRMWWGDFGTNTILATTTAGVTTKTADLSGGYQGIAAGPNGQMAYGQPGTIIGRINPGQAPLPTTAGGDAGFGIVLGTDGAYWTPRFAADDVARLTPDGAYTTPVKLPANSGPRRIAAGANNTLWVTMETSKGIARISGVDPAAGTPTKPGPDRTKPRVSRLKVNAAKRRLSLRLSEAATVRIAVERRVVRRKGGKRRVRYVRVRFLRKQGKAGANTMRLGKKLKAARYRVSVRAVDSAGNRSALARKGFTVKKPRKKARR